jgi:hypothetical protein
MDLHRILGELHAERQRLIRSIQMLEALQGQAVKAPPQAVKAKRGRKHMGAAEREAASERMKRYWAARREQNALKSEDSQSDDSQSEDSQSGSPGARLEA